MKLFFLFFPLLISIHLYAQGYSDTTNLSQTEKNIIDALRKGRAIDMTNQNNKIKSLFLEKLISNAYQLPENTYIEIINASIDGDFLIHDKNILLPIFFTKCTFNGSVQFSYTTFKNSYTNSQCTFRKKVLFEVCDFNKAFVLEHSVIEGEFSFTFNKVSKNLICNNTTFKSEFQINQSEVSNNASFLNAIFDSTSDFDLFRVDQYALFNNCIFTGCKIFGLSFGDAIFKKQVDLTKNNSNYLNMSNCSFEGKLLAEFLTTDNLILYRTTFKSFVDFNGLRINQQAYCFGVKMYSTADFSEANIQGKLNFRSSEFHGKIKFTGLQVTDDCMFDTCRFFLPVDFSLMKIGKSFFCSEALFEDSVVFNYSIVNGNFVIDRTIFIGVANFITLEVGNSFTANTASFLNKDKTVSFNGIKVGKVLQINKSIFYGLVDFTFATIGILFNAEGVKFLHKKLQLPFFAIKTSDIYFDESVFDGGIDLNRLECDGNFILSKTVFNDSGSTINLQDIDVKNFFLNGAKIFATIEMPNSTVNGSFSCDSTTIWKELNLNNSNINLLKLSRSKLNKISVKNTKFKDLLISKMGKIINLDISNSQFEGDLTIRDVKFKKLFCVGTKVNGTATIDSINITNEISLDNSFFQFLKLSNYNFPKTKDSISINEMKYLSLNIGESYNDLDSMVSILNMSKFSVDAYTYFENYCRNQGYIELANKTIIERKNREEREILTGFDSIKNRVSYFLFEYGKNVLVLFLWIGGFIMVGCFTFRKKTMTPTKNESGNFNNLYYTLDVFLPIVNLHEDENWRPLTSWGRLYFIVLTIFGWALMLFIAAYLAGIVSS